MPHTTTPLRAGLWNLVTLPLNHLPAPRARTPRWPASLTPGRYPFWNLTAGRNHIALATNDRGTCDLYKLQRTQPELSHPIKVDGNEIQYNMK